MISIFCALPQWLKSDDHVVVGDLSPPGYAFINVPRESADRGGVGVLFKSQLHLGLLKIDLQFPKYKTFEYTVVSNTSRSLTLIVVYRTPPSTSNDLKVAEFLENFDEFMDLVDLLPGKILMVGDFNVHCDIPNKWDVRRFSTSLISSELAQHIIGPTHRCMIP